MRVLVSAGLGLDLDKKEEGENFFALLERKEVMLLDVPVSIYLRARFAALNECIRLRDNILLEETQARIGEEFVLFCNRNDGEYDCLLFREGDPTRSLPIAHQQMLWKEGLAHDMVMQERKRA